MLGSSVRMEKMTVSFVSLSQLEQEGAKACIDKAIHKGVSLRQGSRKMSSIQGEISPSASCFRLG